MRVSRRANYASLDASSPTKIQLAACYLQESSLEDFIIVDAWVCVELNPAKLVQVSSERTANRPLLWTGLVTELLKEIDKKEVRPSCYNWETASYGDDSNEKWLYGASMEIDLTSS